MIYSTLFVFGQQFVRFCRQKDGREGLVIELCLLLMPLEVLFLDSSQYSV